jgi:hypothetical protein
LTQYQIAYIRGLKRKLSLLKAKNKYRDKKKVEQAILRFDKQVEAAIKKEEERIKRNEERVAKGLKPYPATRTARGGEDTDFYNMPALDPDVQKAVDDHFADLGKTTYIQKHRTDVVKKYVKKAAARNNA